ncbi:MAG: hypothetical protein GXP54_02870 [Deltaproteobacteria bacterium]|nr:hypothetical protein [Deltaproteobacteria bacterium]
MTTHRFGIWTRPLSVLVLLCAIGTFHIATMRRGHDWGGDFALYILNAKNLVEGRGYSSDPWIYNPQYPGLSPAKYPPVFPLLTAPVYSAFGLDLEAMKVLVVLTLLFSLLTLFLFLGGRTSFATAFTIVALTGFNPLIWHLTIQIRPEFLFLGLTFLTLYAHGRFEGKMGIGVAPAIGALTYIVYATRSVGMVLAAAIVIHEVLKRPINIRYIAAFIMTFALLVVLQNLAIPDISSYNRMFYLDTGLIAHNLSQYFAAMSYFWDNGFVRWFSWALTAVFLVAGLFGYIRRVRAGREPLEVFTALYIVTIIIWPYYEMRLLIPLIPLILFYALYWTSSLKTSWVRVAVPVLIALTMASYSTKYMFVDYSPLREGVHKAESLDLFRFVRSKLPGDATILFAKPRVLALFTERKSTGVLLPASDEEIEDVLKTFDVSYVILSRWSAPDTRYMLPFVMRHKARFHLIYANKDFKVLKMETVRAAAPVAVVRR